MEMTSATDSDTNNGSYIVNAIDLVIDETTNKPTRSSVDKTLTDIIAAFDAGRYVGLKIAHGGVTLLVPLLAHSYTESDVLVFGHQLVQATLVKGDLLTFEWYD